MVRRVLQRHIILVNKPHLKQLQRSSAATATAEAQQQGLVSQLVC
jgi:hypothetical protein